MPIFHPDPPRVPPSRHQGESDVLAALRSLGPDIHVFHSLTILDGTANREREIDFLVVHPEWGLLLLEVKGGRIGWDGGAWFREKGAVRTPLRESPGDQLNHQQFRLAAYLKAQGLPVLEFTRILVLPHMDVPEGMRFGPGLPPERVIDRCKLPGLLRSLREAVAGGPDWAAFLASPEAQRHRIHRGTLESLVAALLPSVLPPPTLAELMEGEGRLQDAGSQAILDHLAGNLATGRFRIQGCPGSGKSLIGRMVVRLWAAEGRRALVLCFNRALKVANVLALDDLGAMTTIATFHEFLDVALEELGRPCKPGPEGLGRYFNEVLPAAFQAASGAIRERWGALLVDESQDLEPEWVERLLPLLEHPGTDPVLLLGDPDQALYPRRGTHTLGMPWRLDLNLRQHPSLRRAVWEVMPSPGWAEPPGPAEPGIVRSLKSSTTTWKRDLEAVLAEAASDGLRPRDVLVLLPHGPARLGLRQDQRLGPWRISIEKDWWSEEDPERLRVNTVHAFKGLEADLVVYLAPVGRPANAARLRYVALSRARHRAVILEKACPEPEPEAAPGPAAPPPPAFDPGKALQSQRDLILGALKASRDWGRPKGTR